MKFKGVIANKKNGAFPPSCQLMRGGMDTINRKPRGWLLKRTRRRTLPDDTRCEPGKRQLNEKASLPDDWNHERSAPFVMAAGLSGGVFMLFDILCVDLWKMHENRRFFTLNTL